MTSLLNCELPNKTLWKGPAFFELQESFANNNAALWMEDDTTEHAISGTDVALGYILWRSVECPGSS